MAAACNGSHGICVVGSQGKLQDMKVSYTGTSSFFIALCDASLVNMQMCAIIGQETAPSKIDPLSGWTFLQNLNTCGFIFVR